MYCIRTAIVNNCRCVGGGGLKLTECTNLLYWLLHQSLGNFFLSVCLTLIHVHGFMDQSLAITGTRKGRGQGILIFLSAMPEY